MFKLNNDWGDLEHIQEEILMQFIFFQQFLQLLRSINLALQIFEQRKILNIKAKGPNKKPAQIISRQQRINLLHISLQTTDNILNA